MRFRLLTVLALAVTPAFSQDVDLEVSQLQSVADRIFLTLVNPTDHAGDVLLWVRVGDKVGCPAVVKVTAGSGHALNFDCKGIAALDWELGLNWADSRPDLAENAVRLRP